MINSKYFETEVITNKRPALIVFTASWCKPCKLQKEATTNLQEKYSNKFIVGSIDVDEEEELATKYGARTLPTAILFYKGEIVETLPGYQSQEFLDSYIDFILKEKKKEKEEEAKKQKEKN